LSIGCADLRPNVWRRSMTLGVSIMEICHEFKKWLELFSVRRPQDKKHKVEYLIVGGYVMAFWSQPGF
jgi:hypothetical protein